MPGKMPVPVGGYKPPSGRLVMEAPESTKERRGEPAESAKVRKAEGEKPIKRGPLKTTGSTNGKSNKKGMGGQSEQLKEMGVPGGVIGDLARKAGTAPGQRFYHGGKK